jgi:hypothetical protein
MAFQDTPDPKGPEKPARKVSAKEAINGPDGKNDANGGDCGNENELQGSHMVLPIAQRGAEDSTLIPIVRNFIFCEALIPLLIVETCRANSTPATPVGSEHISLDTVRRSGSGLWGSRDVFSH